MTTANQPIIVLSQNRINKNSLFFKDTTALDINSVLPVIDNKNKPTVKIVDTAADYAVYFGTNEDGSYKKLSTDIFYMISDIKKINLSFIVQSTLGGVILTIPFGTPDDLINSGGMLFRKIETPVDAIGIAFSITEEGESNEIGELRVLKFIDKLLAVSGIEVSNANLSGSDRTLNGSLIFWKEYDGILEFSVQLENVIKRQKDLLIDSFTEFDFLTFMLCPNYDEILTKECLVRKDWKYSLNKTETVYSMAFNLESI